MVNTRYAAILLAVLSATSLTADANPTKGTNRAWLNNAAALYKKPVAIRFVPIGAEPAKPNKKHMKKLLRKTIKKAEKKAKKKALQKVKEKARKAKKKKAGKKKPSGVGGANKKATATKKKKVEKIVTSPNPPRQTITKEPAVAADDPTETQESTNLKSASAARTVSSVMILGCTILTML